MTKTTVLAALLALLVVTSAAAAVPPPLSVDDIFRLELAQDPQVSPDGARVVYVRRFADAMTDRRYANLWVVGVDGTGHRPLTTGLFGDGAPRWSPDGSRIAFVSDRPGSTQLCVLWLDTLQVQTLTALEHPPSGIAWAPDGRSIAFTALVKAKPPTIATLPDKPKGADWAEPPMVIDRLVYRFNNAGYLPHGYTQLFVVPAEGGTARQLTDGPFHHGAFAGRGGSPVWTPDGRHLLVSANRRADWELEPLDTEVWEVALADGAMRALTDRRGPDNDPVVSPDGARLAWVGFDDRYQGYQVSRLYVAGRDGSAPVLLTGSLDRDVAAARWAPDGSGLHFTYADQGNTKLAFVDLAGAVRALASDLGSGTSAYGGGSAFSAARDGTTVFTTTRPDLPGDLAVRRPDGAIRRLTAVNDDLLPQRTLGAVEEIRYSSSKDGRRVHGWLITPPDFDPAKKYPLILEIHGGPFANYGDRFDLEKQLWAARGYVVFYANPRGSTSYGGEFGNLIHHAYPGDDFFDLDSGVDAAIARGFVDPDNLFVTGGSGGGVLTCWLVGRTNRFRAAASAYPVINWASFLLTADIPAYVLRYWFPGPPWEHPEHYWQRSLLSVVGNVKTPTMVITGEQDWRTPMSESEQYYTALKLRGVDSVLVRVPGEPHGIRRRPSHHVAKVLHIVGWFDRYRTTPAAR